MRRTVALVGLLALSWGCGRSEPGPRPDNPARAAAGTSAGDACAEVAQSWRTIPGGRVSQPDSVARGTCRLSIEGRFAALQGSARPDDRVAATLAAVGWARDPRFDADGPDGTSFVLRKAEAACRVEGRWDGGDDVRPAEVVDDRYRVTLECGPAFSPRKDESR